MRLAGSREIQSFRGRFGYVPPRCATFHHRRWRFDGEGGPPILLVHGYMMNRSCMFAMYWRLQRLGYTVATRTSSIEALELFKTNPDRFDLVPGTGDRPPERLDLFLDLLLRNGREDGPRQGAAQEDAADTTAE